MTTSRAQARRSLRADQRNRDTAALTTAIREVLERVIEGDIDDYELSIRMDGIDIEVRSLEQRLEALEAQLGDRS